MSKIIGIEHAIDSLVPDAHCAIQRGTITTWFDDDQIQPSQAEIDAEIVRLQSEYDADYASQAYARSRQAEYPSIEECVHAILDDDLKALQVKRQAVKDKYPK